MKFENTSVMNFEGAFRGLRNPLESWAKSDSWMCCAEHCAECTHLDEEYCDLPDRYYIGSNDLNLAQRMIKAGTSDRKFLRQIFVSVDITAPLYWWKELDTYKIGTTANSTSTMHKLASTPITIDCFEIDDIQDVIIEDSDEPTFIVTSNYAAHVFIDWLEKLRQKYNETKDKKYWKELIRWLPESWLQTRTFTCNYEILRNIVHQRKHHRLKYEWDSFIKWCQTLPYSNELIFYNNGYENGYKLHDLLS